MICDAHCHLSRLPDPGGAVEEAAAAGVAPILAVSMDADEAEAVLALRDRHPGGVLAGAGLHPSRVVELSPAETREHLRRVLDLAPSADFIGEIGLDHRDATDAPGRELQREVFEALLDAARRLRRPVNLHTRRADREVFEAAAAFRRATGLGALMHWFTRSEKMARLCAQEGIFISPGPSVLIHEGAAAVARTVAAEFLLVETDAPVEYPPLGEARPAWAARVASRLAGLRGVGEADLAAAIGANLRRYLGS